MPKLKQIKELRLESNSSLISMSGFNSTITSIVNLVISYSEVRDMTGMLAPEGKSIHLTSSIIAA